MKPLMIVVLTSVVWALQQPVSPARLDIGTSDPKRIAELHATGQRTDGKLVILWTPRGALDQAEREQLLHRLEKSVAALRQLIGIHPWQAVGAKRIVFYVSREQFVSHNNNNEVVMIPLNRFRDGRAPFTHEAAHALTARAIPDSRSGPPLAPEVMERVRATRPLWLIEGLADYLARVVSATTGLIDGDVFALGGLSEVDTTCASRLGDTTEGDILPSIGQLGEPPGLRTTDRSKVAPAFYACALSFTKFLVNTIGMQETIGLMALQSRVDRSTDPVTAGPDGVLPRIESLTGKSMAQLRTAWLAAVRNER
jgi:hypothetical protein